MRRVAREVYSMEVRDPTWAVAWHLGRALHSAARMLCHCYWCGVSKRHGGSRIYLRDALWCEIRFPVGNGYVSRVPSVCEAVAWFAINEVVAWFAINKLNEHARTVLAD